MRREREDIPEKNFPRIKQSMTATATSKTSLENKQLGNGDYFVIIAFSSHPLLMTEHAANGLVEASSK